MRQIKTIIDRRFLTHGTNAEDLTEDEIDKFLYDENLVQDLINAQNIILIGQRGMGKTAYFKASKHHAERENIAFPIYINIGLFNETIPKSTSEKEWNYHIKRMWKWLSLKIIIEIIKLIKDSEPLKEKILSKLKLKAENHILELLEEYKEQIAIKETRIREKDGSGNKIKADLGYDRFAAGISYERDGKETEVFKILNNSLNELSSIQSFFETINNSEMFPRFAKQRIILYFDEVSALRKYLQKRFFIFAKHVSGMNVSVKIAIIPPRFYYPTNEEDGSYFDRRGRDARVIDIFEGYRQNVVMKEEELTNFYVNLLSKRLDFFETGIEAKEIFSDEDTLKILVRASHGNPRDFLELLSKSIKANNSKIPISVSNIRTAMEDYSNAIIEDLSSYPGSDECFKILNEIGNRLKSFNKGKKVDDKTLIFVTEKGIEDDPHYANLIWNKVIFSNNLRSGTQIPGMEEKIPWQYTLNFCYAYNNNLIHQKSKFSDDNLKRFVIKTQNRVSINPNELLSIRCPKCNEILSKKEVSKSYCMNCEEYIDLEKRIDVGMAVESSSLQDLPGIGPGFLAKLRRINVMRISDLINIDEKNLISLHLVGKKRAKKWKEAAKNYYSRNL